tara:strand:+ start:4581 stop:5405 length:825 start_codon:yes stop_codon:yes gene_type:complete
MSFSLKYSDAKKLLHVMEAVLYIVEKTVIQFGKDCIEVSGMDTNRVAFVCLSIEKDDFSEYMISQDKIALGINIREIVKILKVSSDNDNVIMTYNEGESIFTVSITNDMLVRNYAVKLLDIDGESFDIPDFDYDFEMETDSRFFGNIIDSINVTGTDVAKFSISEGSLNLICNGDMSDLDMVFNKNVVDSQRVVNKGNKVLIVKKKQPYKIFDCKGTFNVSYSVPYLKNFSKGNSLADKLTLSVSDNFPCRVQYMINSDTGSYLNFYLAPKITD